MMKSDDYLINVGLCAEKLRQQHATIDKIVQILEHAREENRSVFIIGNGGSAGTAIHMAGDLFKMAGLKAISLDDNVPLMTAIINDEGWENVYLHQLQRLYQPGDIVIALSVHGGSGQDNAGLWSQNLLKAIDFVKTNAGITIGFSGFDGGALKELCDECVVVPAETTPLVESFHVVLHHFIAFALHEGTRK